MIKVTIYCENEFSCEGITWLGKIYDCIDKLPETAYDAIQEDILNADATEGTVKVEGLTYDWYLRDQHKQEWTIIRC